MRNLTLIFISILYLSACTQNSKSLPDGTFMEVSCRHMSEGYFNKPRNEKENINQRTLLYHCVEMGHLKVQKTVAQPIDIGHVSLANGLGKELEKRNIWFYVEGDAGKQLVGLNLYNPNNAPVSWLTVGFYPSKCEKDGDPPFVLFLPLSTPLLKNDQAVLVWNMPSDIKIENGCLDILSAGSDGKVAKEPDYQCFQYLYGAGGVSQDIPKAIPFCKEAAEMGGAGAQYVMGMIYLESDKEQAGYWLNEAAKQGHTDAVEQLEIIDVK